MMMVVVILPFSVLSTAMFTEPTVTQVEEVSSLVHSESPGRRPSPECLFPERTNQGLKTYVDYRRHATSFYLRESGESINLTGTLIRCPSRRI